MSLDFQQLYEQVRQLGDGAPARHERLQALRRQAAGLLIQAAADPERLRRKALQAVRSDPQLRCALPRPQSSESLTGAFPLPELPARGSLIAADGSQINPDRHAEVAYCLVNTGAIQVQLGAAAAPQVQVRSRLLHDEQLYQGGSQITDNTVALLRDLNERAMLSELAALAPEKPVITFTDGPLELWGAREGEAASVYQQKLGEYLDALRRLERIGAAAAGYVDKPGAALVVRLLEIALLPEDRLDEIHAFHPLVGVTDLDLYRPLLGPGARSAVFALQSGSAEQYGGGLALHFFYLNVGRDNHPWLARVEVPAWVVEDPSLLDALHAALTAQCQVLGARPYPYLLHRAHETAVVRQEERQQLTQMIIQELYRRGVPVGEVSYKQTAKNNPGRTRQGQGRF
jgi:hypothetical protein